MCNTHKQLIQVYSEKMFGGVSLTAEFENTSLHNKPVTCFDCPNQNKCQVTVDDPIYTGTLGTCESDVMVVGEAPSGSDLRNDKLQGLADLGCGETKRKLDAHLGGFSWNIPAGKNSPELLLSWVRDYCGGGQWPYFTDAIKCGTKSVKLLKLRGTICPDHILIKEIGIINPRLVICCHDHSYSIVARLKKAYGLSFDIVRVMHYSDRKYTSDRKRELIWPLQIFCKDKSSIRDSGFPGSKIQSYLFR